jgi:hypothetical protein
VWPGRQVALVAAAIGWSRDWFPVWRWIDSKPRDSTIARATRGAGGSLLSVQPGQRAAQLTIKADMGHGRCLWYSWYVEQSSVRPPPPQFLPGPPVSHCLNASPHFYLWSELMYGQYRRERKILSSKASTRPPPGIRSLGSGAP